MHVDDAVDELRDKEKMNYIEAQEKALRKMHVDKILGREEHLNKLRDFQVTSLFQPLLSVLPDLVSHPSISHTSEFHHDISS